MKISRNEFAVEPEQRTLRLFFVVEFDEAISGRFAGLPVLDDPDGDDGLVDEQECGGDERLVHFWFQIPHPKSLTALVLEHSHDFDLISVFILSY